MPSSALPPEVFENAYLSGGNPRAQSGFGGDEERWGLARRPIADAIHHGGTFLDVGCASGYLMESVVSWARCRIEPYGVDFAPGLVELARRRLPHWADRIFLGDALSWEPPRKFDVVRIELVYVPDERQGELVARLLDSAVAPRGRLIVCGYGSPRSGVVAHPVRRIVRELGYEPEHEHSEEAPEGGGALVEVAALGVDRKP